MVDYKRLADEDVGGDLDAAYATMAAMTVTSTPEVMITYRRISAMSFAAMVALETAIKANAATSDAIHFLLKDGGIDVNDPQVADLLDQLVPDHAAAIIGMGVVTEPKYAGFKIGHLANARQMRQDGRV